MPNRFDYSPFASIAPSLQPRAEISRQLADDVEAFLRRGGQIEAIVAGQSAERPKSLRQLSDEEFARTHPVSGKYMTNRGAYVLSARRGRQTQARGRGSD